MVVNEKALVRQLKSGYKGGGYSVLVRPDDTWVFKTGEWVVTIEGQRNVPNEVLSLIVLHMGYLPGRETSHRILKGQNGPIAQEEIYAVANEGVEMLEELREAKGNAEVKRTKLMLGSCQLWQRTEDLGMLMINPELEQLLERKQEILAVGGTICAEGEISRVYIVQMANVGEKAHLEHLSQMQWVS
jgi:hypothetical protein